MKKTIILGLSLLTSLTMTGQTASPIRVNQVGYYPHGPKSASVAEEAWTSKYTLTDEQGRRVWSGKASRKATSPMSGKRWAVVDFSQVTAPGTYTLSNGRGQKQTVVIAPDALGHLTRGLMKAFYFSRSGEPILEAYAGKFARPMGHPDTRVLVHGGAASPSRPEGTVISSPRGWYDAGDYNKYIVNSAFTIGMMLTAYEAEQKAFENLNTNIPESDNDTPDMLDEIMVNLQWMQTMQDPGDGGVYNKLTNAGFDAFVMPDQCTSPRYVVAKCTSAAYDFAAVMAQAARVYGRYPQWQTWAAIALVQAEKAFEWAQKHPHVVYDQAELAKRFKPAVSTGVYESRSADDEWYWAATELELTTGVARPKPADAALTRYQVPVWGHVAGLAAYALLNHGKAQELRQQVVDAADEALGRMVGSCFQSPYGNRPQDFGWGCLAEHGAGTGLTLMYAYKLTGERRYLEGAAQVADYILGRNATGYCYVTGYGTFSSRHPHFRLMTGPVKDVIPGYLVGGPNPGQNDKKECPPYPSAVPDESYLDVTESYASNEIAINWNATMVAFTGWLDYCLKED